MTVVLDPTVAPVAATLLNCLAGELAKTPHPPAMVSYRVGASVDLLLSTVSDECCTGVGWVRLVSVYGSDIFPQPNAAADRCDNPIQWAAVLEMGAARCAPIPDAGEIPLAEEWDTLAEEVFADAAAMRRAMCCFAQVEQDRLYVPGLWQPLPVEGGCAGGIMQVTVAVGACDCDE